VVQNQRATDVMVAGKVSLVSVTRCGQGSPSRCGPGSGDDREKWIDLPAGGHGGLQGWCGLEEVGRRMSTFS